MKLLPSKWQLSRLFRSRSLATDLYATDTGIITKNITMLNSQDIDRAVKWGTENKIKFCL
jgi:hypothetical protein